MAESHLTHSEPAVPTPYSADADHKSPATEAPRSNWRLPDLASHHSPSDAVAALDRLARRGKLPGFERLDSDDSATSFRVSLFGEPFDRSLIGRIRPEPNGGGVIAWRVSLHRKTPIAFVVSTIIAIWPGLPMLDKVIPPAWNWWPTWTWYLPIVIVPTIVLAPIMWRRSERAAREHAQEQLGRISEALAAPPANKQTGAAASTGDG